VCVDNGFKPYALDLLGYGYSDKPNPKDYPVNGVYNFEHWGDQVSAFVETVVQEPAILVCNSVGGVVGLQSAVTSPELIKGIVLIDISLRMLHTTKQPVLMVPFTTALQTFLRETGAGKYFFKQIATPKAVSSSRK